MRRNERKVTLVNYLHEPMGISAYKCGYCKSPDTSMVDGMLGYTMTCQDYQELVDRGFQRSGRFVYRPVMNKTCCPQYVFRMDVTKFRQSKKHRATVRKMNKFLDEGEPLPPVTESAIRTDVHQATGSGEPVAHVEMDNVIEGKRKKKAKKPVCPGLGPDPSKPLCKKAKVLRRERRAEKMKSQAMQQEKSSLPAEATKPAKSPPSGPTSQASSTPSTPPVAEWQEEKLAIPSSYRHTFSTRLVCCSPRCGDFIATFQESYFVFKKFQMGVHNEDAEECKARQFNEFLVETPLTTEKAPEGSPYDYGSYHLQYLIDGRIYAVGVLDILPKGVLCEYLYYDPYYRFIAPGVYTALQEIAFTQKFYKVNPKMQYYYMGFYVQSCPKMNYKRHYSSSQILCPETYEYVDLPKCIPLLEKSQYSRLGDPEASSPEDDNVTQEVLDEMQVTLDLKTMTTYKEFCQLHGDGKNALMWAYAKLVGVRVARTSRVHLGNPFV